MSRPDEELADRIRAVMLFETEAEMTAWRSDADAIEALKRLYPPRRHHCLFSFDALQVLIVTRG